MFAHIMTCYVLGQFTKKWHKTGDFRDLLLEGAIFIVGTQNLP